MPTPPTPVLVKIARPPFSKPHVGCPINWANWSTRGLVASWPLNEGIGQSYKEYASGHEFYTLTPSSSFPATPSWATVGKVLALDTSNSSPGDGGYISSQYFGITGTDSGLPNLPQIDFTWGFTIHLWFQVTDDGGASYGWFSIGDTNGNQHVCALNIETSAGVHYLKVYMGNGPTFSTYNTSATPWATVGDIPNQIVVTVDANPVTATWVLNAWDVTGAHLIQDYVGTGTLQNFDQYNFNGFFLNSTGSASNHGIGYMHAANVWDRPLGEYEIKRLMYNPLQMYEASNTGGLLGANATPPSGHDLPTVTLSANPTSISAGFPSQLTWTSQFADTLVIDQTIGGVTVPSGNMNVFPVVTTTYTITATNTFGTATASATVTVTARGGGRPPGVSTGAILQRDLTKTTDAGLGPSDNGTAYTAWATIGSVILVHPSELAEVLFLTTEAIATGSHPALSVILDEIAPSIAVPFVSLGPSVPDPAVLVESTTIYTDRFYISQTQEPAICRHLQVRIDWPAEAFANELLTWSVIGAHVEDR